MSSYVRECVCMCMLGMGRRGKPVNVMGETGGALLQELGLAQDLDCLGLVHSYKGHFFLLSPLCPHPCVCSFYSSLPPL